jgi:hypothetical protein
MSKDERDCPEIIIKTAKTAWQKEVGIEFVKFYNRFEEMRNDIKWCKWTCVAVLATIAANIVMRLI